MDCRCRPTEGGSPPGSGKRDIPPVREVIGDAGRTFRPDDAVDLAVRIDELLAAPEKARAMAERGRQRINDLYTWEHVGSSVMNGYALAALKGKRHSPRS